MKKRITSLHATARVWASAALLVAAALLTACDQAPLFFDISKEIAPKDPLIEGTPSRMVLFAGREYVANGRLWAYNGVSWARTGAPSGAVRDVAVVGSGANAGLYVLTVAENPAGNRLYASTDAAAWVPVPTPAGWTLQGIFGAGDELFVAARDSNTEAHGAFRVSGVSLVAVAGPSGPDGYWRLSGAAKISGGDYYLATVGRGIFYGNDPSIALTMAAGSADTNFHLNGIIATANEVAAVGRRGHLLAGTGAGGFAVRLINPYEFTGALTLRGELLLAGGTEGYREILLSAGAIPAHTALRIPGAGSPTTVADGATYEGSLGQRAVNHLYSSTLGGNVLFASTQKAGLWSYRDNVWNAED